jgi:hypothetical protein
MKKFFTVILMISAITAGTFSTASATDFLIGVKGGYYSWDPFIKRIGVSQFEDIDRGNGALYGPVFSVLFTPDLSLSLSGLFGQQSTSWTSIDYNEGSGNPRSGTFTFDVTRIDIDSALSYRLTDNFKIIAGYKYQNMVMEQEAVTYERSTIITTRHEYNKLTLPVNGPALGLGISAPMGDRYFFAANLSALYMWGKLDFKRHETEYKSDSLPGPSKDDSGSMKNIKVEIRGINFEPTIGASMGEGMPIFTLGIRTQWTQLKIIDADKIEADKKWCNDYQYGLFVSIVQPI